MYKWLALELTFAQKVSERWPKFEKTLEMNDLKVSVPGDKLSLYTSSSKTVLDVTAHESALIMNIF